MKLEVFMRRAQERDVPGVTKLLGQVLAVHAKGRPDIFKAGTTKYTREELAQIFENDSTPVFVALDGNGDVVGHAFCIMEEVRGENNLHDMKSMYIDDICVDENHRKQGIAAGLYEYAREYAKKADCYHITLNVWEINPGAKAFYETMGMKPLKTVMEEIL